MIYEIRYYNEAKDEADTLGQKPDFILHASTLDAAENNLVTVLPKLIHNLELGIKPEPSDMDDDSDEF